MANDAQRTMSADLRVGGLRAEADDLWPKGMEPVPGVGYETTQKRIADRMREAADTIETLTKRLASSYDNEIALTEECEKLRTLLRETRPVLEYVSRGRRYIGVEPYPDALARRVLGEAT